jgi:hypothetical protein
VAICADQATILDRERLADLGGFDPAYLRISRTHEGHRRAPGRPDPSRRTVFPRP